MAYGRIEIPTLVREPLPWNLMAVAEDVTPANDRWTAGIAWESDIADAARSWNPLATGEARTDKDLTANPEENGEWSPTVLYGVYKCPTPTDDADIDRVRRRLDVGSSAGLESAFWTWAFNQATPVATGTATEVVARLGQAVSDSGLATSGILHMPARAAEIYLGANGFNPSAGNMPLTARGDRVSVGAGYPSTGTAESQWVVISGPVGYLLSEIEVLESPESIVKGNMRELLAERYAALQVDSAPLFKGLIQF